MCGLCRPPDQAALDERRRQSIRKMEAGTVSKSIKEAMASAFQKFTTGVTPDGTTLRPYHIRLSLSDEVEETILWITKWF